MGREPCFAEARLAQLHVACSQEPRLAALYAFDVDSDQECNLAVLYTETPPWSERLDLELAVASALELGAVELISLRRMPLVSRYDVINRGEPIYVGQPEALAIFLEETIARFSAFYPLLEALYWKTEARPEAEDMPDQ